MHPAVFPDGSAPSSSQVRLDVARQHHDSRINFALELGPFRFHFSEGHKDVVPESTRLCFPSSFTPSRTVIQPFLDGGLLDHVV